MFRFALPLVAFTFVAGCSYYKNTTLEERQKRRKEVLETAAEAAKAGADAHEAITGKDNNVREKIEAVEPLIDAATN